MAKQFQKININSFTYPKRVSDVDLLNLMYNLNSAQREFVMHILKSIKIKNIPLRILLSGSAGVGKSTVININSLAIGQMTVENINLIKSTKVDAVAVPDIAIRLFAENVYVDLFNYEKITKLPGTEYQSEAKDTILGKVNNNTKSYCLESLKNKKKRVK